MAQHNDKTRKHIEVVAAVVENNGFYLALQRGKGKSPSTDYKWEFPGGKIEPGETREEALVRELREEMDYAVQIERPLNTVEYSYPDFDITLHAFLCHPASEEETLVVKEHAASAWLRPEELRNPDWCDADIAIIDQLVALHPEAEAANVANPSPEPDTSAPTKRELWLVLAMIVLMALLYFLQRR